MSVAYHHDLNFGRFEVRTLSPEIDILQARQVHGAEIATTQSLPCSADGLMVLWEEYQRPIAIKTADCLPVVIEGEKGVVCLHAGWRGLALGILQQPQIEAIKPLRALIGPSIHPCCFEVTAEFKQHFPQSQNFKMVGEKLYFDLQQEAHFILSQRFPQLQIEVTPICTSCRPDFHSYRRDKILTERNWNLYIKG